MNKFTNIFLFKLTYKSNKVVKLETCLNPSILWLPNIIYCKNLTIYIFNLTQIYLFSFKFIFLLMLSPL
jgi:hypothetical protein